MSTDEDGTAIVAACRNHEKVKFAEAESPAEARMKATEARPEQIGPE